MNNEIAIVMAAGLGTRMLPITDKTAKPLVKVRGTPMIETVIGGLEYRGVRDIYVVVGYKKEQFGYLTERYGNLTLIENKEYLEKNNISSIHAVCDMLGHENCFICEADLYISDREIFRAELEKSCYFGKFVEGHSDDWVFEQDGSGRIIRIGTGGDDVYNMVGIAYFLKDDARILADRIRDAYRVEGHGKLFWDDVVNLNTDLFELKVHPVSAGQIVEIDTVQELVSLNGQTGDFWRDV